MEVRRGDAATSFRRRSLRNLPNRILCWKRKIFCMCLENLIKYNSLPKITCSDDHATEETCVHT